jgi:hypothetical protein
MFRLRAVKGMRQNKLLFKIAAHLLPRLTVLPFDGGGERPAGGLGGGDCIIPMVSETTAAKMHKTALEIICRRCLRFLAAS